jgi:hypothetical protein
MIDVAIAILVRTINVNELIVRVVREPLVNVNCSRNYFVSDRERTLFEWIHERVRIDLYRWQQEDVHIRLD